MKHRIASAVLLASLALAPVAAPASHAGVTCTMRTTSNGRSICYCRANRAGSWWQSYPRFFCQVVR